MDDQFGGRTDDDLFADEFEPVEDEQSVQVETVPAAAPAPVAVEPAPPTPTPVVAPQPASQVTPVANVKSPSPAGASRGLQSSRHATQAPPASTPRAPRSHRSNHSGTANANNNNHNHNNNNATSGAASSPKSSSPAPTQPSTRPDGASAPDRRHQGKSGHAERIASGANPRTKLTEDELADKMRKMAILNAERAAKFKQEEADRQSHEVALVKASEQAKKRRAEEAERKKREAADRRQMDDERERNRERKLRAMEAKAGGSWDEGKEEREREEEQRRGGFNFRGANGGVRGGISRGGGLGGSRFAAPTDDTDFMSGHEAGRGRGRGGRGGRGSRGGFGRDAPRDEHSGPAQQGNASRGSAAKPSILSTEEFPALPGSSGEAPKNKKIDSTTNAEITSPVSPLGNWGDEMEAQDEKNAAVKS